MTTIRPKPFLKPALEKVTLEHGGSLFTPEMIEKMVASIKKTSVATSKLAAAFNPWAFGTVWRNNVTDATAMAVGYRQVIGLHGVYVDPPGVHHTTEEWTKYWTPVA